MRQSPMLEDPKARPLVSLLLCLLVLGGMLGAGLNPPRLLTPDTIENIEFARCLETFQSGLEPATCHGANHWSPGLPLLLSIISVPGVSPIAMARWISLITLTLLPIPLYFLGSTLAGRRAGLWAAALSVPCAVLRLYALIPDARPIALLATFAAYAALGSWFRSQHRHLPLVSGLFAGIVLVFRPEGKLTLAILFFAVIARAILLVRPLKALRDFLAPRAPKSHRLQLARLFSSSTRQMFWEPAMLLASGAAAVVLPVLWYISRVSGRFTLEPRSWELPAIGWFAYLPIRAFLPLFGLGAEPTPFREVFTAAVEKGEVSFPLASRITLLLEPIVKHAGYMADHLGTTVRLELVLLAVPGIFLLWRRPHGWARVALWALILSPLIPLTALAHTFNPQLPEGNLLFVPVALTLIAGVTMAELQQKIGSRSQLAGALSAMAILALWTLRGLTDLEQLTVERQHRLFESSGAVERTVAWLKQVGSSDTVIHSSYAGAIMPSLAGLERTPWLSSWEMPAALAGAKALPPLRGNEHYILVTSVDLADRPMAVLELLRARPELELVHHEGGPQPGLWVAIYESPQEDDWHRDSPAFDESPPDDAPPNDTPPPDDTPPEDAPPDDTMPPDDTPPEDAPPDDTMPPDETPPEDAPPDEAPQEEAPAEDTPWDGASEEAHLKAQPPE